MSDHDKEFAGEADSGASLTHRLALARTWLLTGHLRATDMCALGADPWQLVPPADQRARAAVAQALRELADGVEQQLVQVGAVEALLLGQPLDQQSRKGSQ
jgi:hypothetical protein